ncbi:MAG: formylglycine-generating enzyme family protein [Prochloraceae cyanobacterium]|nr:formylglycine-generating enzyme family protein [Prochloraceae cyanobacterium]
MTPETPNDDPLLKFIAFTQASKWEFDTYQIADILWLWSQVVNGNSKAAVAGRLLKSYPSKAISPDRKISSKNDPEIVIKRFASTASPFAWELMKKLSAVPINLPIIRLIQQQLLPYSTFVDAVEVILSGLLKTDREMDFHINPNLLEFEFIDGIRDILLKSYLRKTRSIEVIRVLSDYVAKKLGLTTRQFEAQLLTNPTQWKGKPEESLVRPFATIAAEVFGKLGEEYAQLATQIKYSSEQLRQQVIPPKPNFPQDSAWLTFLKKIVRQYKLTAIEIETLITLFPNPQQSLSITDAADRLSCSRSAFSSRLSRIYRKFETLTPNLFSSNNKLKTLHEYLISQYQTSPLPEIPELETLESFEFEAEVATIVEKEKPLQQWTFETPTVNRRGETIKTTPHTASYFTETLTDSVGIEMVAIPGGTFTMGSPENEKGRYDDESPQHQVTVSPFFMGKYPVTQAQWKAIASRTELKVEIDLEPDPSEFKGDNRPVEQVNWYEAVEFCQRLSRLTGRDYRLPSEAEWEYACRGVREPLNLENGESYPPFYFGETISEKLANYDASVYADEPEGEYRGKTTPVGQFPPNAFGLYDLHGNVWEWCADDWHDNYEGAPTDGSAWLDSNEPSNTNQENQSYSDKNDENDSYSVMRGGSWSYGPDFCRSAARYDLNREYRYDAVGFRVVCGFGRNL